MKVWICLCRDKHLGGTKVATVNTCGDKEQGGRTVIFDFYIVWLKKNTDITHNLTNLHSTSPDSQPECNFNFYVSL